MLEDFCIGASTAAPLYGGPERRRVTATTAPWLTRMLDEIDHGLLLLTADGVLRHANQPARRELALAATLLRTGQQLRTAVCEQHATLLQALADAGRGRRRLLNLGTPTAPLSVAAVPLERTGDDSETLVLLVLGKRQNCETLTLDFYARSQGLTSAEARVLHALCKGLRPKEVARECNVAVSTVRTQITSIRQKTQTASIRDLVNRVSTLPPIAPAMRLGQIH